MCVVGMWKVKLWVVQSCPTICHPTDYSLPGSSLHGILKERIMEWVAIAFSRGSSRPRDQTRIACIAGGFFTVWPTRLCLCSYVYLYFFPQTMNIYYLVLGVAGGVGGAKWKPWLFPESLLRSCLTSSAHHLEPSTCPTLHPGSREQPGTVGRALGEPGVWIWVLAGACQWHNQGQVARAVRPGFLVKRRRQLASPPPGIRGFVPENWNALCVH